MSFNVKDLIVSSLELGSDDGGCPPPTWLSTQCTLGVSRSEMVSPSKGLSTLRQQLRKTLGR